MFSESVVIFLLSVGFSSVSNCEQRFLVPTGCIVADGFLFKGGFPASKHSGHSSFQILLFSVCITSLFLFLQLFSVGRVGNYLVSLSCSVTNILLCSNTSSF